jgi:hypothetical protein
MHAVGSINFDKCLACGDATSVIQNASPLNDDEAYDLATHFMFDRFYADWELSQSPDRLDPALTTDEHVLGIYRRAEDLLSSHLAERTSKRAA